MIYITYNLRAVAEIAHRVMVMYAGRIEHASIVELFTQRGIPIAAA
jgi:ABC-type dipeptide/oligopeptide/nickel transport system ATPase component